MAIKTRKLYASITATTNDAAHIDIVSNGVVRGIDFLITNTTGGPAAGDYLVLELSTASTGQTTTNDANGILGMAGMSFNVLTSGAVSSANKFCGPTAIPVKAGDRLYLNCVEAGGSTWQVNVVVHIES